MNNIWTIDELVDAVWNTEQIDDYYLSKDADWSWASTDEIQNETWLPCPGIKNTWASNLGRIKIGNKIKRAMFKFQLNRTEFQFTRNSTQACHNAV